ncbi:MAG TPA: hypothetical protein VHQ70_03610 [Syntrophomonadaceae bacterium]|nr:hypothetical protein [Syntrophomonadaceae bacterium]
MLTGIGSEGSCNIGCRFQVQVLIDNTSNIILPENVTNVRYLLT